MKIVNIMLVIPVFILGCTTTPIDYSLLAPEALSLMAKKTEVWGPEPVRVLVNQSNIPYDATVLFDGKNVNKWVRQKRRGCWLVT